MFTSEEAQSSVTLDKQLQSVSFTTTPSQPTVTTTPSVAVRSDKLFQSLTPGMLPKDEKPFDRSQSMPTNDSDDSLVKNKLVSQGII